MSNDMDYSEMVREMAYGIEKQIRETEEEFIYTTISPFCERIVEKKLSKQELEKILRKGMQFDKIRAEIEHTGAYEQETCGKTEFLKGIDYCLGIIDKYGIEREVKKMTRKEEQWIPVGKRQPDKSGEYWCTFGGTHLVGSDRYMTESDAERIFDDPGEYAGWRSRNVIAWMPMPKPYKAEREGE